MNRSALLPRTAVGLLALLGSVAFPGCIFEVPITVTPTRKVDERLPGNWSGPKAGEKMNVRKLDDSGYIISFEGELFRAFHTDLDGVPYVSVQDLNHKERKYWYVDYRLSDDGQRLTLRAVNTDVIPAGTQAVADVQALLRQQADHRELFIEERFEFTKEKEQGSP